MKANMKLINNDRASHYSFHCSQLTKNIENEKVKKVIGRKMMIMTRKKNQYANVFTRYI